MLLVMNRITAHLEHQDGLPLPTVKVGTRREVDWWGDRKEPDNRGRAVAQSR